MKHRPLAIFVRYRRCRIHEMFCGSMTRSERGLRRSDFDVRSETPIPNFSTRSSEAQIPFSNRESYDCMNFTFVRAERSQEENQERAFIAASRRQDRDFKQRLESLQKASDLHFARTGKRFVVTQAQVEHNGPLMELGDCDRRRESQRYQPYSVDRRAGRRDGGGGDVVFDTERQRHDTVGPGHQQHVHPQVTFQPQRSEIWNRDTIIPTRTEAAPSQLHTGNLSVPEIDVVESQSQNEVEDTQNLEADDLHPSFFELETWSEHQEDLHGVDIQGYLDMEFPTPRHGTPEQDLHLNNQLEDERANSFLWGDIVQYDEDEEIGEEEAEIENDEGYW